VLATPLLRVLDIAGFQVDVLIDADYDGAGELLLGWSAVHAIYDGRNRERPQQQNYAAVLPAVPPFYWRRYAGRYARAKPYRPPDELFFRDEQAYYLDFARVLGCEIRNPPYYFIPVTPEVTNDVGPTTVVIAPGCKTGAMAAKRWPFFPDLTENLGDVAVVGTDDDLLRFDGTRLRFPKHVRSLVGQLSLRQAAGVLASAGAVVANDSGLGHLAAALGVPTILLFGPTAHLTLGRMPPNVTVLRTGLECEPCWHAARHRACNGRIDCLIKLSVTTVAAALCGIMPSLGPALTH
jgi:hypothetical protein